MKLDPLINRRVIFKLYGQAPMESTILGHDDTGWWIKGGTLAAYLRAADAEEADDAVQFLELTRVEWFHAAPENRM